MMRPLFALLLLAGLACAPTRVPQAATVHAASTLLVTAAITEARGSADASQAYVRALESALTLPPGREREQGDLLYGALHALLLKTSLFGNSEIPSSLASTRGDSDALRAKLTELHRDHPGWARGIIATALFFHAVAVNDPKESAKWRSLSGFVDQAFVRGPIAGHPLLALSDQDALPPFEAPPGVLARSDATAIPLSGPSARPGLREVVFDVEGSAVLGIRAMRAARVYELRAGALHLLSERRHQRGGTPWTFAPLRDIGRKTLVVRIPFDAQAEHLELHVFSEGAAKVTAAETYPPLSLPTRGKAPDEAHERHHDVRLALALGALAADDGPTAEKLLFGVPGPLSHLLRGHALRLAPDLSPSLRNERVVSAYESAESSDPSLFEANLSRVLSLAERKGGSERNVTAIASLQSLTPPPGFVPIVNGLIAALASGANLPDIANAAASKLLPSPLKNKVLDMLPRAWGSREEDCVRGTSAPLSCFHLFQSRGKSADAFAMLEKARTLLGNPRAFPFEEIRARGALFDLPRVHAIVQDLPPGDRPFLIEMERTSPSLAEALRVAAHAADTQEVATFLRHKVSVMGDWDARVAKALGDRNRATDAATLVLLHEEEYTLEKPGILHATLFDLRRTEGTSDIDQHAEAERPMLLGRANVRTLRKRIHKKDGRILLPDPTPRAAQAHADLAQLEQGDAVEVVYDGWALPDESGQLGFDSPDLLPPRTTVQKARVTVSLPESQATSLFAHPLLVQAPRSGQPREYTLTADTPRRVDEGTPRMDRRVGITMTTLRHDALAKLLRETRLRLLAEDPEVDAFLDSLTPSPGGQSPDDLTRIVAGVGKALRKSVTMPLADYGLRASGGADTTARGFLAEHQGPRSLLVLRGVERRGYRAELAMAEEEPFSAFSDFPAHDGRFVHPLVLVHTQEGPLYLDADVEGPPLPPGRVSPGLVGRTALTETGALRVIPEMKDETEDEVDLRLRVSEDGTAKGQLTVILRGRDAQLLSELFEDTVGDERVRLLRNLMLSWLPDADVEDVTLSSTDARWQLMARSKVSVHAYPHASPGRKAERLLPGSHPLRSFLRGARVTTLGATHGGQAVRQAALAIESATRYHVHRRIELPDSWRVTEPARPLAVSEFGLRASRSIRVDAHAVEDDFVLRIPTRTVSVAEYGAFLSMLRRIDDAFLERTRIATGRGEGQ